MEWFKKTIDFLTGTERKKVRARDKDGKFVGDDESTPDVDEAYTEVRVKKEANLAKIEAHERECTIRYENIERRLEEGSKRFNRLELMIWGLYAGMAAIEITSRVV
jgi:hypothetical protein